MKLKIKNYRNIIGGFPNIHVEDVVETDEYYTFHCRKLGHTDVNPIRLGRDGYKDGEGDWIYHFYNGRNKTQCVTPEWFESVGNAISAIGEEVYTQY